MESIEYITIIQNGSERCNLNVSKCRHENKFYLNNYKMSNMDEPMSAHKCSVRASIETNGNPVITY